jgi:biotin-(acetyl-CoA carboxylase) ligase
MDVDSDGALILETTDGKRKRVVAGDVEYSKHREIN